LIGNFYRDGKLYTQETVLTFDHDFPSLSEGVVIPYGIYDLKYNHGYVALGISHDTSEFACDSIRQWWWNCGCLTYAHATSLLLLCDGGGSNSSRTYLFKADLEKVSQEIGIEIRVAHYPPYTSKYNPIEHRLFPHLTRACQGVIFSSVELVRDLMSKTTTKTGLEVEVTILDCLYETGRKVAANFKEQMRIIFDNKLPQWNYRVLPGNIPSGEII
jgi:Rhodopirellula transposase DDE domain